MSKKSKPASTGPSGWGPSYIIPADSVSNLEGRLLTLVESLGLNTKQEEAVKSLARQEVWRTFDFQNGSRYLPNHLSEDIRAKWEAWNKDPQAQNVPL